MLVRIWGCRGSIAAPGADTAKYGGNTSCVEVRLSGGEVVILDAGTGLRALGAELVTEGVRRIHLLITHLHVDHIEGLGVFGPIWSPETELHLWGPPSPVSSLEERIARYFSPPLFPVHLSEVPARITFHDTADTEWSIDAARFASHPILHPGPTVGYRIEDDGAVLTYLTDHEPGLGVDLEASRPEWISGFALAYRADLLIHDCQYTSEEYTRRVGWGHSSVEHVATFVGKTEARSLLMFHHDPMHTDAELESIREEAVERTGLSEDRCTLAAEGASLEI